MESIYAIDSKNGLSKNGSIPWKSKKDMKFFMTKTSNNIVIMGKTTYFSLPAEHRPLKNRLNIVLTSTPELYNRVGHYESSTVLFTNDNTIYQTILENKEKYANTYVFLNPDFKIFCIGGKTVYDTYIPLCDKIWVSYIKHDYNCDLFIHYDFSTQFTSTIYDEDDDLKIVEYKRI
jgi:dihydrofolate reductase